MNRWGKWGIGWFVGERMMGRKWWKGGDEELGWGKSMVQDAG